MDRLRRAVQGLLDATLNGRVPRAEWMRRPTNGN